MKELCSVATTSLLAIDQKVMMTQASTLCLPSTLLVGLDGVCAFKAKVSELWD